MRFLAKETDQEPCPPPNQQYGVLTKPLEHRLQGLYISVTKDLVDRGILSHCLPHGSQHDWIVDFPTELAHLLDYTTSGFLSAPISQLIVGLSTHLW